MPRPSRGPARGIADASLAADLGQRTVPQLRAIARALGWRLSGTRREDILAQVLSAYGDPQAVAAGVAALEPPLRELLQAMAWLGSAHPPALAEAYEALCDALPDGALPHAAEDGHAAVTAVWDAGLLAADGSPSGTLCVPVALAAALPPAPWTPRAAPTAAWRREPAGDGVALATAAALFLATRGDVPLHPSLAELEMDGAWPVVPDDAPPAAVGGPRAVRIPPVKPLLADAAQAELAGALGGAAPEPERAALAAALLVGMGVLTEYAAGTARVAPEALAAWLGMPPADRPIQLLGAWAGLPYPIWDEVSQLVQDDPSLRHYRMVGAWRFTPAAYSRGRMLQRSDVLFGLGRLQTAPDDPAGWVDGPALAALVAAAWEERYVLPSLYGEWFLARADGSPLLHGSADAARLVERLLARQLRGDLRALGLVETAVAPDGTRWAVRLSPFGRAFVAAAAEPPAEAAWARWDAAAPVIELVPGTAAAALVDAARFCAAYDGPAGPDAPPCAVRFRLAADTAARAFDAGTQPEELAARFAAAGAPLPEAARAALDAWWARWGSVNRYDGLALVEVADEALARLLRGTLGRALEEALVYQPSATSFVVAEHAVDELLAALRRAGHTPRVTEGTGTGHARELENAAAVRRVVRRAEAKARRAGAEPGGRRGRR